MKRKLAVLFVFFSLLAAGAFGYEITERYRLGAVVEGITYISNGPLAGKVALVDGWSVYIHDPALGSYERAFSVAGLGFRGAPRGLGYLSQGDYAGNILVVDAGNPNTFYMFSLTGTLIGAVHAQDFQWNHAEGVAQITSGPDMGKVAMIVRKVIPGTPATYVYHIYIFSLKSEAGVINAYLDLDIPNISFNSDVVLGLAFLPEGFPDPAFRNTFAVTYGNNATLCVFDRDGHRLESYPCPIQTEGLTYLSGGPNEGKLLCVSYALTPSAIRNLDGTISLPTSLPSIGLGLYGILNFTWLKDRQQMHAFAWDGLNFNIPGYLISHPAANLWYVDAAFRMTHFLIPRNLIDRTGDGTYKLFGVVSLTTANTILKFAVDSLDAGLNLIPNSTMFLPSAYDGLSFGNLVYVPGESPENDRYITPCQNKIYSFDPLFRYPAQITDISGLVTTNIGRLVYDPAVRRYYVLDGAMLRIFDAGWKAIDSFDLSGIATGPFGAIGKITSGDLLGSVVVLNSGDNELILLNYEYQIAGNLLDRLKDDIRAAGLKNELANSLTQKLQNAAASVEKKNIGAAINKIEAFQNEIRAQTGKDIPVAAADRWLALATDVIRGLQALQ